MMTAFLALGSKTETELEQIGKGWYAVKKKIISLILTMVLALSLFPTAFAVESVTPAPPSWCPEEEYAVFPGSAAYEPENWDIITQTRDEVAWGAVNLGALPLRWKFTGIPTSYTVPTGEADDRGIKYARRVYDFGVLLEKALVEVRLLYTHDKYDGPYWTTLAYTLEDGGDEKLKDLTDQQRYAILLWTARGVLRYKGVGEELNKYLPYLMEFPQFSLEKLTDTVIFTEEEKAKWNGELGQSLKDHMEHITVWLDGNELPMDVSPEVKNERTMVPIRAVAEALGADVAWDQATQGITLTRAGTTVSMTLDNTTAMVNGTSVEMDVAPYATGGRTLIPARYVAEFFGQKVDWDGNRRQVLITEDKSMAEGSNLEEWAIQMGLIYGFQYYGVNYGLPDPAGSPIFFGMYGRTAEEVKTTREGLLRNWSIGSREKLLELVPRMTFHGHNDSFQTAAADANSLTEEEMAFLLTISSETDKYMWPYTQEIYEQWGEKGILAWDLSRMGAMVQWGYTAGYITYAEALELIGPAAQLACETFSDWREFHLNYLDGYNWWARNDVYTARNEYKEKLRKTYGDIPEGYEDWMALPRANYFYSGIFSRKGLLKDDLFQTGVIGLPED